MVDQLSKLLLPQANVNTSKTFMLYVEAVESNLFKSKFQAQFDFRGLDMKDRYGGLQT